MGDMHLERLDGLQPSAREKARAAFGQAENEGLGVLLTSGLRTYAEQDELYAQGRTKPGKVVTNARAGESYHNFGLAFDFVVVKAGRAVWDPKHPDWKRFVRIAKAHGYAWGGDWPNPDNPHFQTKTLPSLTSLRAKFPGGYGADQGPLQFVPRDRLPLRLGHKDGMKKLVSKLQRGLGIRVNGRFGKRTESAVTEWQAVHNTRGAFVAVGRGLEIDGRVGRKTWDALFAGS